MPTLCLRLNEEESFTMTHIKLAKIEVESDRTVELPDGTLREIEGYMNLWFSKCRKSRAGNWIEDPVPGINVRFSGAQWKSLKGAPIGEIRTMEELEGVIYGLCRSFELLPRGELEPYES